LQKCSTSLYDARSTVSGTKNVMVISIGFLIETSSAAVRTVSVKGADQKQTSISSEASVKMVPNEGIVEDKNWQTRVWFSLIGKENPKWRMNSNSVPSNLLRGKKKENRQAFAKHM
jgi:hypothetical protein